MRHFDIKRVFFPTTELSDLVLTGKAGMEKSQKIISILPKKKGGRSQNFFKYLNLKALIIMPLIRGQSLFPFQESYLIRLQHKIPCKSASNTKGELNS